MTNQKPPEPAKEALLTEYEACQHDNNSSTLEYWTLTGIFIGISSVLLGGILYRLLSNNEPSQEALVIITVLSVAVIVVLAFLCLWVKRVNYLADINYWRMREIELKLGMLKSWRVHSLDKWHKLSLKKSDKLSNKEINEQWAKLKQKMKATEALSKEYLRLLEDRKKELVSLCNRYPAPQWYKRPTRELHYPLIIVILIALWVSVPFITWFL